MIGIAAGRPGAQDPHGRKFGLLDCEHAFCLGCIRGWRSNADASAAETVRRGGCLHPHPQPRCLCGCKGLLQRQAGATAMFVRVSVCSPACTERF